MQSKSDMDTREIPREQWIAFFDDFSKRHQGWIVTLEVIGPDIGDQEEASGLPLVGIIADLKGGENRIEIMVGSRPDSDLTHIVNAPGRVWMKQSHGVADEAVEVEAEDGTKTLLSFRRVSPEQGKRQLPDRT